MCNDRSWIVAVCASSVPAALCVDCADPCASDTQCSAAGASSSNTSVVISPCVSQVCGTGRSVSSAVRLLTVSFNEHQPAPAIESMTIIAARTALTVSVHLSAAGTAYCAAYTVDAAAPTSVSSILLQNSAASTNAENVSDVTLAGLTPASSYQVYCMTVSPAGTQMSLASVLSSGTRTASTLCCIELQVQLAAASVTENQMYTNLATLVLEARPAVSMSIEIRVFNATGARVLPSPLVPSSFAVTSSGTSPVSLSSSLNALPAGAYSYQVHPTGDYASQFDVIYAGGISSFVVQSTLSPLPAPVLTSAKFSEDGSYVRSEERRVGKECV